MVVQLTPLPAGTTNLAPLLPQFDSTGKVIGTPTVDVGVNAGAPGTDMLLVVMYPWPSTAACLASISRIWGTARC